MRRSGPKIDAVHKLAKEFKAELVPFDQLFAAALKTQSVTEQVSEVVHLEDQGHAMMAKLWIKSVLGSPLR